MQEKPNEFWYTITAHKFWIFISKFEIDIFFKYEKLAYILIEIEMNNEWKTL